MKKLVLLAACALFASNIQAQEIDNPDIVVLSKTTLDVDASNATALQTYVFDSKCKGITLSMKGRALKDVSRQGFATGLNFKLNEPYTINLPEGVRMYGVQFAGYSQGDNWDYLYAYGSEVGKWEWIDNIGTGIKDNNTIINSAVYSMDPCESKLGAPVYNKAGYTFASIGFDSDPYEGAFIFNCSGNNQYTMLIRVFTSKEAWDNYSETCKNIQYGDGSGTGITEVTTNENVKKNDAKYNISGARISTPNGLYITNGKTYLKK